MEPTQTLFNLNNEMANWQQTMQNGALTPDDVSELTQHLQDEMDGLQAKGLNEEEAWIVARTRIGQPLALDIEFSKVNPDFAASRNMLMLFWGGTIFMLLQSLLFNFPNLLSFIVRRLPNDGHLHRLITDSQTVVLLNVFSILIVGLVIFSVTKANQIAGWFNNLLVKRGGFISLLIIIIGSFVATINFLGISSSLNKHGNSTWEFDHSLELLGIIFYGSLVFCTAWFTIRYRKQEFRSLKVFSANINWVISLSMGVVIEMLTCIGNMMQSITLRHLLTVLLFAPAAWMVSNAKNVLLNLFMLQVFAFYMMWVVSYTSANQPLQDCAIGYSLTLLALFAGYMVNKRAQSQLQTS